MLRLAFTALLLALSPLPVLAQSSDPAWLDTLNFQMEHDKDCEVSYYIRIKEGVLGTQMTYEARLQCKDGRQFDATRVGDDEDFTIKECEIQVC
jgi:hypothetical protein